MGRVITREFLKKPMPFVIVERDPEIFSSIDPGVLAIGGAGIANAILRTSSALTTFRRWRPPFAPPLRQYVLCGQ